MCVCVCARDVCCAVAVCVGCVCVGECVWKGRHCNCKSVRLPRRVQDRVHTTKGTESERESEREGSERATYANRVSNYLVITH